MNVYAVVIEAHQKFRDDWDYMYKEPSGTVISVDFEGAANRAKEMADKGVKVMWRRDRQAGGHMAGKFFEVNITGTVKSIELLGEYGGKAK